MEDFEIRLHKAIDICEGNIQYIDSIFSRVYSFTTENILGYLKYFDLKDKKLLTVGSSGDQILNAYFCGARDITLIDINEYAKFYLYLKIAAIMTLTYEEFENFFIINSRHNYNNDKMFSKELFKKIKPALRLLDYESYLFFDELFTIFEPKEIRCHLFDDDEWRDTVIKSFNIYLRNEKTYNILKKIIHNIHFEYINENIFNFESQNKYDNILLSNICTYISTPELKELIEKLSKNNLNNGGKILMAYLWGINFSYEGYELNWKDIYKLPFTKEILKDYITEYHEIKSDMTYIHGIKSKKDLVLMYKKRGDVL